MTGHTDARPSGIERVLLLVAGSISAGVHAGLVPGHLREWPPLGVAFIVAAVTVSAAVTALAMFPTDHRPPRALVLILGGLVAAYASSRLLALPPLDPTREPLDPLGLATSAVEAAGLLLALHLSRALPFALRQGETR